MSEHVIAYYDVMMSDPIIAEHHGGSGYFNVGYWTKNTTNAREACDQMMDALLDMVSLQRNARVLDVACGMGATSEFLAERFGPQSVVGINVAASQLQKARVRVPAATFIEMDATALRFPDGLFDLVICVEAAFHFDTREAFFREAYRVLRPDGCILLADALFTAEHKIHPRGNILASTQAYRDLLTQVGFREVQLREVTENSWYAYFDSLLNWVSIKRAAGELSDAYVDWLTEACSGWRNGVSDYIFCSARR